MDRCEVIRIVNIVSMLVGIIMLILVNAFGHTELVEAMRGVLIVFLCSSSYLWGFEDMFIINNR